MSAVWSRIVPKTLIEWLAVVAIIAILIALLVPPVQWASSGSIRIPVQVVVFNPETGEAVQDARVAIVRGLPAGEEFSLADHRERLSGLKELLAAGDIGALNGSVGAGTGSDGTVTLDVEFRTEASHKNPVPRAHTRWYWVLVSADRHGTVAVPLRYESLTTKQLREQKTLLAYVGLLPQNEAVSEE